MASSKPIRIEPSSLKHGGTIVLPRAKMKEFNLTPGSYTLAFGQKNASVRLRSSDRPEPDVVRVSSDLIHALHLPVGEQLSLYRNGEQIGFGYVFGILANLKTDGDQVCGSQQKVFRNLLQSAHALQMYGYVFSVAGIDWESQTVLGYRLEDETRWANKRLPLPDVVYDQIISRTYINKSEVAQARERLMRLVASRYFNPGYFDKWQVQRWLKNDRRTAAYMPDAIRFESVEQSAPFLYQYSDVYLKPVHGSLGIGIIRAQRRPDGRVFYQIKKKDGSLRQEYSGSVSVFLKKFQVRLKKGPYMIQRTLRLKNWQGRPFDIRILLQKDGTGSWQRTKMFCRIAQHGQITSNLSSGGDALAVKQLLKDMYDGILVRKIIRQLREVAEAIPLAIEQGGIGTVGELGLDLGLDEEGRIWVIEVNAKPWKKPNTEDGEWRDLAQLAFQRPVQYAKYLCETALNR